MGFSLSLPSVARKTSHGIPRYDGTDVFVLSDEGELTPAWRRDDHGQWVGDRRQEPDEPGGEPAWTVVAYRPRHEGAFARIEHWRRIDSDESYWRVRNGDNVTHLFGRSQGARICDPDDPHRVFQWLLEETVDPHGNKIRYAYKAENGDGKDRNGDDVLAAVYEAGRDHRTQRYPATVDYGNYYEASGEERFAFRVVFDYGERDLDDPDAPPGTWTVRPDPFSSYRSGFEIRTLRRCEKVLVYHSFHDRLGGKPFLTRALRLDYEPAAGPATGLWLLRQVEEIGFRQRDDGTYERKSLPPASFTYSAFHPAGQPFRRLEVEEHGSIPGPLGQGHYDFVDLRGEGLPGLFYSDGETSLYWEAEGGGRYARPRVPGRLPLDKDLRDPQLALASLEGNGELDLVVHAPGRSGFYRAAGPGTWDPFQPFATMTSDLADPHAERVDMDGGGRSDVLLFRNGGLKYYPSRGRRGYGPAVEAEKAPGFPAVEDTWQREVLTFADLFGDGLSHRVRVRDGLVECWPNLGRGRFGAKVVFGNAPRFGDLDDRRLFLADVDGSGTADLVYVRSDRIEVCFNQSGNRFSDPLTLPLPVPYDDLTQVSFADVLGNGTSCLILTRLSPEVTHFFYDFAGDAKPHLLTTVDNHMGATTRITYTTTVKQYLEDKRQGRPWPTRLFFPVHVVEEVEHRDEISRTRYATRHKYHDAYYDPVEREFRGFGFVESWDTGEREEAAAAAQDPDFPLEPLRDELYVPPAYSKSWYHTGAFATAGVISRHYAGDYWQGDDQAPSLPESTFDPRIYRQDAETVRQAYEALTGQVLRHELYGLDGSDAAARPYSVSETNVEVRLLQPRGGLSPSGDPGGKTQRYAVFLAHTREALACHYERDPTDPRVEHDFTLEVDDYGNETRSCAVAYPRRRPVCPEQEQLWAVVTEDDVVNHEETTDEPYRWIGAGKESRELEVQGLEPPADGGCFSFEDLKTQVEDALANPLDYHRPFTSGKEARLVSWSRSRYWNEAQDAAGEEIASHGLLHHAEHAVLTPELVQAAFGDDVDDDTLAGECGYHRDQGYWWNRGLIQYYFKQRERFFLPSRTDAAFEGIDAESHLNPTTTVGYDDYHLLATRVSQLLSDDTALTVTVENDYQTLEPWRLTDLNGNVSEVLFDPLGMVAATTVYGTEDGRQAGDDPLEGYDPRDGATFRDVVETSRRSFYLQGATTFFFYDLFAWSDRGQPASAVGLHRETHVHDPGAGGASRIRVALTYSDGFGRVIASKAGHDADRWLVSGRTVYNNKGLATEQYLPYFSETPDYEEATARQEPVPPSVLHYDPLDRRIRTDSPKGFYSQVEFSPWEVTSYDEDDTVKDSTYYKEQYSRVGEDEKDALDKAAAVAGTPSTGVLDPLGRTVRSLADNQQDHPLTTLHVLDVEGREVRSVDPRLFESNVHQGTDYKNFTHLYDMAGNVLRMESADAGNHWSLVDVFGKPVHTWDSRGFHTRHHYDRLARPVRVEVEGGDGGEEGLNHFKTAIVTERIVYGEGQDGAAEKNLNGRVYRHYDPAGLVTNKLYAFSGEARETVRRLRKDVDMEADWTEPAMDAVAREEAFTTRVRYDAVGQVVEEVTPDGSVTLPRYNLAGQLQGVAARLSPSGEPGETPRQGSTEELAQTRTFVDRIDYDANGQRTFVRYGNGVETSYTYEPTTLHLLGMRTVRPAAGGAAPEVLQDITYAYDPVGNVTRVRDSSWKTVFCYNQKVEPLSDYTYDALYRLTEATGRQHPGLQGPPDGGTLKFLEEHFIPFCPTNPQDQQALERYTETYRYDDGGNLTQIKHEAASGCWTHTNQVAEGSNHLADVAYDGNGNTVKLDHLRSLVWSYRDNIARADVVVRAQGTDDGESYLYDGGGSRVLKVARRETSGGTEVEEKIYLGNYELKRIKKGAETILERRSLSVMDDGRRLCLVHDWAQDDRQREAKPGERSFRYQLDDHLGSVALEVDEAGKRITYEEYFPYGGSAFVAGRSALEVKLKDYRYSGKERDAMTGLYYYGARYYPPWLGRWLNPDPAGTVDGLNLYAFVKGNPVTHVDINGNARKGRKRGGSDKIAGQSNKKFKKTNSSKNQDRVTIEKPADWKKAHRYMNKHTSFILEFPKFDIAATISSRRRAKDAPPNIVLEKNEGFGGSRNTQYTQDKQGRPETPYTANILGDKNNIRIARRVIKGTIETKSTKLSGSVGEGDAVAFGALAKTSERARGELAPAVALVVLGAAREGYFTSWKDFAEAYIPSRKAEGSKAIREFTEHALDVNNKILAAGRREAVCDAQMLYCLYPEFFRASDFYLRKRFLSGSEESSGESSEEVFEEGSEEVSLSHKPVFDFLKYVANRREKYAYL